MIKKLKHCKHIDQCPHNRSSARWHLIRFNVLPTYRPSVIPTSASARCYLSQNNLKDHLLVSGKYYSSELKQSSTRLKSSNKCFAHLGNLDKHTNTYNWHIKPRFSICMKSSKIKNKKRKDICQNLLVKRSSTSLMLLLQHIFSLMPLKINLRYSSLHQPFGSPNQTS